MNNQTHSAKQNKSADPEDHHSAPVADKLKQSLHSTVDAVADKAEAAEKAIRSGAANSAEALSEKQQEIQESWEASSVRKYAVENPVATAGIVFIAGALFGKFMSRN